MDKCSIDSLRKMTFDKNIKPYRFHTDVKTGKTRDTPPFLCRNRRF